jgi:putative glycosyltransferase (TIGR04348 family)
VHRESIVIVTPALQDANNGNWQTAHRWSRMLQSAYRVRLAAQWSEGDEALMIALHARRSATSVAAWRAVHPLSPLLLALTGTDLYRDIDSDASAMRSLAAADTLIVLNQLGAQRVPAELRPKCHVLLQSCPLRRPRPKTARHLRALMVGHLRDVKDPCTYFRAAHRLRGRSDIVLDHVGSALDPTLGAQAAALAAAQPNYRWLGGLPHTTTRRRIQAAHVLVHASRIEGGAHVVIEAIRSGTPVLASRIAGNLGLLGEDYCGTFAVGDDAALATLLQRARDDPDMLPALQRQLAQRASLFAPERESATLRRLVADRLAPPFSGARR